MNKWWQSSVVYQVYPRSFKDSNNDGIGDIEGIISKLDYLKYLGIDVIWLSPVYESPNEDNGYDISDYYNILADFGTLEDMERLIKEAEERGIKIIMDLVTNHTSTKHKWFQEGKTSKENKYHDFYVFRDEPNDIQSIFLGSAWKKNEETDEYYLHMFAEHQADLNWENIEVRQEIYKMVNWWLDKGIGGFRLDVIDMISKDLDNGVIANGPNLHKYIKELTKETFSKYDVLTVGETWGATAEKAQQYSNLNGEEFSMIFNFSHILLDQQEGKEKWDYKPLVVKELRDNLSEQQTVLHGVGWNSLFWNNHDLPRIVSRWGNDKKYRVESAKMFATISHFMQGTPYIYQGEEIGMTNVKFENIDDYKDIETLNMYKDRLNRGFSTEEIMDSIYKIGRDNARTPMQWSSEQYAGFSQSEPWIQCNENYKDINVESQIGDENSVLEYYRKLIKFRRESNLKDIIMYGEYELILEEYENIFAYNRKYKDEELTVLCNFSDKEVDISLDFTGKSVLINNYPVLSINKERESSISLRPYESIVFYNGGKNYEEI